MTASSPSSSGTSRSSVESTMAAGNMSHIARGFSSLATKSSSELEPVAPSPASSCTTSAFTSYTTHRWPSRIRRRTRLAPIRPSPTMPSCIGLSVAMSLPPTFGDLVLQ